MEVSDLILADYAAANERGKFTLVGAGFTNINTKKVPYVHSLMFLLIRLKITRQDIGKNRVEVKLVGEKGPIFQSRVDADVSDEHKDEQHLPITIRLANLRFVLAGDYSIEVRVNGEVKQSQNLKIILTESQAKK